MAYYNRFEGNYDEEMQRIHDRLQTVIDSARSKEPANADELLNGSDDAIEHELEWVDIQNPRLPESTICVRPIISITRGSHPDAREKYRYDKGVYQLIIEGRLPTGESEIMGNLFFFYRDGQPKHEPAINLYSRNSTPISDVRWDSADAELFLTLTESALAAQPE